MGQTLRGIEKGAQIIDGALTPFTGIAPGSKAGKLAAAAKITYDERARIQSTGKDVVTGIKDGMERLQKAKEEETDIREKLRRKHGFDIH